VFFCWYKPIIALLLVGISRQIKGPTRQFVIYALTHEFVNSAIVKFKEF